MATVTSLTADRIQELLAGWESIGMSQDEINALVIGLQTNILGQAAAIDEFNNVTRPHLEAETLASSNAVSDLVDVQLPALRSDLDGAAADVQSLVEVTIPSLQNDVESTVANVNERPSVYVQDEEPTNPDDFDRDLVVGDTWFELDNTQHIWDGTEWTTLTVDVADFSLTAQKFKTSTHMLY